MSILKTSELKKYYGKEASLVKALDGINVEINKGDKAIINKLTKRSIKANKLRNLFAVIAIALTTILFTSLFTIGMGMVETIQQQTMRQSGGYTQGTFKNLTKKELNDIKDHPSIKEFGYSILVNMAENKEFLKHHTEVRYATSAQAKMWFCSPTKGRMPEKENEVATDTAVLDLLGVPHEIGKDLTIEYSIGEKKLSTKFVLSGFWESDEVAPSSMVFVPKKFIDKNLAGIKPGDETGRIDADVVFKNSLNINQEMEKVLKDKGYSSEKNASNYIETGVNWAYMSTNFKMDPVTMLSFIAVILLIIFTGYLIIYNIFQISVIKDIRFYGLLKIIGMTQKQIQSFIKRQALLLSVIGIPIGLLIGYLLGNVLLPLIMSISNYKTSYISFSPVIFIAASLFSLITVFLSCSKPGKAAAKVSPVEAVRYVDVTTYGKAKKNSSKGGKIYNMALSNISRNKKKTIVVIISISLSLILLNAVFTVTKGFDENKFLRHFVITDFTTANANYFNTSKGFNSADDVISENMIEAISNLEGIKNSGHKAGEKIALTFNNSIKKEYEVMARVENKFSMSVRYILDGRDTLYLPSGEYLSHIKNPATMSFVFDVKDKYIKKTEHFLQNYTKNVEPQMNYESKQKYESSF